MSTTICMRNAYPLQFGKTYQQQQQHRQFAELHFFHCFDCGFEFTEMSAVPQGAFAACKVRENEEKFKRKLAFSNCANSSLSPLQYNSKLMNSIWGMYNRYSVHNLKKNIDADLKVAPNQQQSAVGGVGAAGRNVQSAQKYSC